MPKKLKLEQHNHLEELEKLYRQASDPIERTRWQIIWLVACGYEVEEVAKVTGYRRGSIYRIVGRYNQSGADGLKDLRHEHQGPDTLLSETEQALLWIALQEPPQDGGLWNGRKVADWMSNHLERPIHPQRGWEYLRSFEMRLKVPRPAHELADLVEQENWKKKLEQTFSEIRQKYPGSEVELWAMDEHRLGLKPILRRVWVNVGEQPIANVYWRYQWLWLYGFVHPESGETYYWILPKVNTDLFNQVLADFAREFKLGQDKHIILTLDRAGWHTSKDLNIPEGLHLEYLPAYSPELQPAERLWPLVNEPIANRCFDTLEDLEEVLFQRCKDLLEQQILIRAITYYHWWPQASC